MICGILMVTKFTSYSDRISSYAAYNPPPVQKWGKNVRFKIRKNKAAHNYDNVDIVVMITCLRLRMMTTVITASKINTRTPPTIATTSQIFTGTFSVKQNTQGSIRLVNGSLLLFLSGSWPFFMALFALVLLLSCHWLRMKKKIATKKIITSGLWL